MKKYSGYILISLFFLVILIRLIFLWNNTNIYQEQLDKKVNIYIEGISAPRGRILDVNGNVLVDNVGINTIMYNKIDSISKQEELDIALMLADILDIELATTDELKSYWLANNSNGEDLITSEEYQLLEERKITTEEIEDLKLKRITDEMLDFPALEQEAAHIYALMNIGYLYQKKVILMDATAEECALVVEKNIAGITVEMTWKRVYLYDEVGRSFLGSVGSIPASLKDEYLNQGYALTDIVGISYLEKEYENTLKGTKALYQVNEDNSLTIISEAIKGQDLILSIDINIQQQVEEILKEKILLAKDYPNTEYFRESYAIVGNPNTGEIIAMAGMRLNDDHSWSEVAINNVNTSYTMGSSVKGATVAVGYKYYLIEPGKYLYDRCVKLYFVPQKCSHKPLGRINDIDALAQSSNFFQYQIAIKLTDNTYTPNMQLHATEEHFNIYRDMLKEFGLGATTEIDLAGEVTGIKGSTIADDLLLNLSIGQYDTYTPIQMLQYINTVASGSRYALSLKQTDANILNELSLESEDLTRIREGLQAVLSHGTGKGYIDASLNPVGKTGTSQTYYDGIATISSAFAGYFPADEPKYSIVVISPNISHNNGSRSYLHMVARRISYDIAQFLSTK